VCIWTDGSRDDQGNVGAAVWSQDTKWVGHEFRLGRNKDVFDAELYGILQATATIRDEASRWKANGLTKVTILSCSHAALKGIKHNGIGPGQAWATAVIHNTEEICDNVTLVTLLFPFN
jgi:hypothetical protein